MVKFSGLRISLVLILCIIHAISIPRPLAAQDVPEQYKFSVLDIDNGLSHNLVKCIFKDSRGFMWFGTESGLNRYDGYKFRIFKYNAKDPSSIIGNSIRKIFEDPAGNIWVQTNFGISIYDHFLDKFSSNPQDFLDAYNLPGHEITDIIKDDEGNFWFLIKGQGIARYNPLTKTTTSLLHSFSDKSSISTNDIVAMDQNTHGDLWVIHQNGLFEKLDKSSLKIVERVDHIQGKFPHLSSYGLMVDSEDDLWINFPLDAEGVFLYQHQENKTIHFHKGSARYPLNNNLSRGVVEHSKDEIWVGTDHGGINVIDKEKLTVRYVLNNDEDKKSLANNSINTMYKDDQEIIWIGTVKNGVSYYHQNIVRFTHYKYQSSVPESLPFDDINDFVEDSLGNLWLGTNGGGLLYLDMASGKYQQFRHDPNNPNSVSSDVIVSLYKDRSHQIWIGTYMHGLDKFDGKNFTHFTHDPQDPNSISDNSIWEIYEDVHGNIWLGTLKNGLELFDVKEEVFRHYPEGNSNIPLHCNYITTFEEDKYGNLWIGGGFGIDVINLETGENKYYAHEAGNPNSLVSNHVMSIYKDSRDQIWVATYDGLSLFNEAKGEFINYSVEDGLPNNSIISILEDEKQNLWVSTANGISNLIVDREADDHLHKVRVFRNYDELDGLQGKSFNENAALKLSSGALLFGGSNGFNIFNPTQLFINEEIPQIAFTDFQLFNRSISVGEEINGRVLLEESLMADPVLELKHNENVFSFEFAALNFVHAGKNQYRYKLEGFDKEWLPLNDQTRRVTYTNLDPGDYEFKVMASNNDGVWNEGGASLKLAVLAPFWKTTEAYLFYFLTVMAGLYYLRRLMITRERQQFLLEQERRDARKMHELDMMKIKFFTNVSHEFRTPLSLILAPVEKLMNTSSDGEQQKQFQMIQRNGKRLLNLVNHLLDFRKLEVEGMKLNLSEYNVISFVEEAVQSFSDLSENKNIALKFRSNINTLQAAFDMDKLEKILFNLLSNAFKFTPEQGVITVEVNCYDNDSSSEGIKIVDIKVSDTGIGIPKEKLDKIFERFFTSDVPQGMVNQGSGIGLSITKEFVKIHGGSIQVESDLGKGSCFRVTIPVKEIATIGAEKLNDSFSYTFSAGETNSPAGSNTGVKDKASRGKMPLVLIVEDNDDFRFYLKDNLGGHFTILEARNGSEGWQKALANMPDLIVSDLMMPEMDGLELSTKVKADSRTSHIPIVLLTANAADEQKLKGLKVGVEDYITKPFNFEILLTRLVNLIEQRQSLQKVLEKKISVQTSEVEIVSMDDKLVQKTVKAVEENLSNPEFSVEDLSREVGMSRVYLYKKLTALTGKSPVEFIRHIRLQRAAQLLEKSQLSVAEVAYKVGFNNRKYFTKYFKHEYKVLPSLYAASKAKATEEKE